EAARRAAAVLAFERAAEHYALVLRLGKKPDLRAHLLERQGEMLANAGRCAEAARSFNSAAEALGSADRAARALRARSGELWLRSGYVKEGLASFQEVLRAFDLEVPASEKAAMLTAVWLRLRLMARGRRFQQRPPGAVPAETLEHLDT